MTKLPDKLSELIRLALHDENAAHRSSRYEVDMSTWHSPNGKCSVCFAGSVMAFSLEASIEDNYDPCDFDEDTQLKLKALHEVHVGDITAALACMPNTYKEFEEEITGYHEDRKEWRKDMYKAIRRLEKHNL